MSKRKFVQDNLILIVGGFLGNIFSFLINIILVNTNSQIANLYVFYNTISIILAFPSLVLFRIFSTYGWFFYQEMKNQITKYLHSYIFTIISLVAFLIFLIHEFSYEKNILISIGTVFLSILTIIAYALRGLQNYELDFSKTIISFNIETGGRLVIGYLLGFVFYMGLVGWILGAIISMLLSLIPLYKFQNKQNLSNDLESNISISSLKKILLGSIILSLGLELMINLDIAIIIANLSTEFEKTEYNIMQILRKIIFYSTITIIPYVLSKGYKSIQKPKLIFFYTIVTGLVISSLTGFFIFLFRDIILIFLNKTFTYVTGTQFILFLISCILITLGYLVSNWLFSQNNFEYTFLPILNAFVSLIMLINTPSSLENFISSSLYIGSIFFITTILTSIYQIVKNKNE